MQQRPYVFVNMAVTADGKIDTVQRGGARISGAADRTRVDRLRAGSDAIVVGGHTLLGEDPRLTVRDAGLQKRRVARSLAPQPTKVGIVSAIGYPGAPESLPEESRFLRDGKGPVVLFTTTRTKPETVSWLVSQGAVVHVHDQHRVDLVRAFDELGATGVETIMVEGGSTLVAALLAADLVDELQLAIAPLIVGGADAPTPVDGPGLPRDAAIGLTLASATANDDGDVVLRYLVSRGGVA